MVVPKEVQLSDFSVYKVNSRIFFTEFNYFPKFAIIVLLIAVLESQISSTTSVEFLILEAICSKSVSSFEEYLILILKVVKLSFFEI